MTVIGGGISLFASGKPATAGGGGGSGDVVGPASSVNNGFVVFSGTTGKLIKEYSQVNMQTALDMAVETVHVNGNIQAIDEGTPAGNARGQDSVDLQQSRSATTQVASGGGATIAGGDKNTADGIESAVGGGQLNDASGLRATIGGGNSNTANGSTSVIAGGRGNIASDTYCTVGGGQNNVASSTNSTVGGGESNTASSVYSTVVGGNGNIASAGYSTVVGGFYGVADLQGMVAHANGRFSVAGDAQSATLVARNTTADATPVELFLNGSTIRAVLTADKAWAFRIDVIAFVSGGDAASFHFEGAIKRDGANNTSLIGGVSKSSHKDAGASAWDADVTADDTNEALKIQVTGAAATSIRWVATIQLTQVAY